MAAMAKMTLEELKALKPKKNWQKRPLTPGRKAWYRQDGESHIAYAAFIAFLMLPAEQRSVRAAAEATGKSQSYMRQRHFMWSWAERAACYEEHYMLLRLESVEADRDQMWRDQKILADTAIAVVTARFEELLAVIDEDKQLGEELKPDALVRMFDIATKVQRMAVLGRIEGAAKTAEEHEKLAERYADELSTLLRGVVNDLNLTEEQKEIAAEVIERRLVGA